MGWGLKKSDREELMTSVCMASKDAMPPDRSEVVDMNAAVRLYATGAVDGRPIQAVASQVVRAATMQPVKRFFAVFDRPGAMPGIRSSLHNARYASTPSLDPGCVAAIKKKHGAGKRHLPARRQRVNYKRLFTPGPTKTMAWTLFAEAVWYECTRRHRDGLRSEVYFPSGATGVLGRNTKSATYATAVAHMGEADLAAFDIAAREAMAGRPVIVRSVDTDLILQTVASGAHSGKVFVPPKAFLLRLKGFTVDGRRLIERFGGDDPSRRLSAAFWMIMAGGTDYSKPASDQGYYKKGMAELALCNSRALSVTLSGQVTLNLGRIKGSLAGIKRRSLKAEPPRTLKGAISDAARSACYYGGYRATGIINTSWELSDNAVQL